jgi:hypothetical protein
VSTRTGLPILTRRPHQPLIHDPSDARFPEVLLYFGNACNRECAFCCVDGRPGGSYRPFTRSAVRSIFERIRPDARVKLYGGEPTLYHNHLINVVRALRAGGYVGRLTIFSNGIQAARLIAMLDADPATDLHPGSDAYLNHLIWLGRGADPIPEGRRRALLTWAAVHPGRLFLGHEDILPVGGAAAAATRDGALSDAPDFAGRCARCYPTFRSDGTVHACAFAAEVRSPQYDLGTLDDTAEQIAERRAQFLQFIEQVVEPEAALRAVSPCRVCLDHARTISELQGCPPSSPSSSTPASRSTSRARAASSVRTNRNAS